jgi:hypothetical protein
LVYSQLLLADKSLVLVHGLHNLYTINAEEHSA